jgi:hypothetical protein
MRAISSSRSRAPRPWWPCTAGPVTSAPERRGSSGGGPSLPPWQALGFPPDPHGDCRTLRRR